MAFVTFQPLSPEAGPLSSWEKAQRIASGLAADVRAQQMQPAELLHQQLLNQQLQQTVPYAGQQAQADLLKQQLMNKYYPQATQSEINLRQAQGGLYGTEAAKNNYMLQHPGLLAGGQAAQLTALKDILPGLFGSQAAGTGTGQTMNVPNQDPSVAAGAAAAPRLPGGATPQQGNQISQIAPLGPPALQNQGQNPLENAGRNLLTYGTFTNPAEIKSQVESAGETAKQNVRQWNEAQNDAAKMAQDATQATHMIDDFRNTYKKAKFVGPTLSKIPLAAASVAYDVNPEQQLDQIGANMMGLIGKYMVGGRVTNYEAQNWLNKVKLGREMLPETVEKTADVLHAVEDRSKERQQFLNAAQKKGLSRPDADVLWTAYDNEKPLYDFSNSKRLDKNENTWQKYLTKDSIERVQSGTPFGNKNTVTIIAPDGSEHQIAPENVDVALKRYPGVKVKNG
jgi:hypothetical protein